MLYLPLAYFRDKREDLMEDHTNNHHQYQLVVWELQNGQVVYRTHILVVHRELVADNNIHPMNCQQLNAIHQHVRRPRKVPKSKENVSAKQSNN